MIRLILMRHSKTEPWTEGVDDFGRALTDQGKADAKRMAEELVAMGCSAERILVSSARRTRETCSEVAKVFEGEKVRPMESLYLSGVRGLAQAVSQNDGAKTLMVIGHNPGLHDFAMDIHSEAGSLDPQDSRRLIEKFPTSCCAIFESEEDGPFVRAHFKLVRLVRIKDFREADASSQMN